MYGEQQWKRDGDGFRLRGGEPTRLDTFVDAAFAFAVTLLVISFDGMPEDITGLLAALRQAPAFVASFAVLAVFWLAHRRFSRRHGLESGWIVFFSLVLVAVTLLYVYPLRMIMGLATHFLSGGWVPSVLPARYDTGELRAFYLIYGAGFSAMCALMVLMNLHALRHAERIGLDARERLLTRHEVAAMLVLGAFALTSMLLAAALPMADDWSRGIPGLVYALLPVAMGVFGVVTARQLAILRADVTAEPSA